MRYAIFFTSVTIYLTASCGFQVISDGDTYKCSPDRNYCARIHIQKDGSSSTSDFSEKGTLTFYKAGEVIHFYTWKMKDGFEPSFTEAKPIIEWISDSVLRLGEDRSDQPFLDEAVISNYADKNIKFVSVSNGKFESFWLFDIQAFSKTRVRISPRFKPDGSSNSVVGYGGAFSDNTKFEGTVHGKIRKSPDDGANSYIVDIR
jgi:hypothetical protein